MPYPVLLLCSVVAAYLLGSVPFAVLVSRLFGLSDPRSYGSKNPGATNVLRSGHKLAAVLTLLGDMAKGWLAVFLAQRNAPVNEWNAWLVLFVALAVFFGHLYPLFLKFKGGKGVATAAGVLFALNPWLGGAVLVTWFLVAYCSRYSSLAALSAAASAPLFAFLLMGGDLLLVAVAVLAVALINRHWANLQRLVAGTEPKIGEQKKASAKVKTKLKS